METVYLDTETTGLNGGRGDEIVELAIIDDNGDILINTMVKPSINTQWDDAQRIHGISPADVVYAPSLKSLMPEIEKAISGKTVIIYNSGFDINFFPPDTFKDSIVKCCMLAFARQIGEWNEFRGGYRWHKLIEAADHVDHEWSGVAHRALADTLATRSVWHWLQAKEEGRAAAKAIEQAAEAKLELARKKQRDAYRLKVAKKEKIFAKSLRKRGATPDTVIKSGTPEREIVFTRYDIFTANREGEKWVIAGYGFQAGSKDTFLLYRPFK